jgi:3-vinyl bacteriochlorophyllide hydratase
MTIVHSPIARRPDRAAAGGASAGVGREPAAAAPRARRPLYTPEQRRRRDATRWTLVQGILAPLQLLAMLVSVVLVLRYLATGEGLLAANGSVVVKTLFLYVIMITGAIWEKVVFGQYLFHEAFFWEDVVSFGVIAVHTAYLWGLAAGWNPRLNLTIALVAYGIYTINAIQFLLKLKAARRMEADGAADAATHAGMAHAGASAGGAA